MRKGAETWKLQQVPCRYDEQRAVSEGQSQGVGVELGLLNLIR